ncbi:MAG: hypothetical protein L6R38_003262 [Xanthoria sp. 2 TBL-2021]|nr:MAG: hypothetical protein L6R38_003262 [Xanthoria sp. 2 TBL-2021]
MTQQPVLVQTASLHNKVALITGAGRGIGRGCAIELGKRGCSVVVNYATSKASADEVVKTIQETGTGAKAISIQADVTKLTEIDRLFRESKQHFGKIDVVFSNSGTESFDKTEEISEEKYDHVFNLNSRAQFFIGQAAWKHVENNGRLILMSSISAGVLGVKDHALYNASKMAVIGLVKAFATDFGPRGGSPDWSADKIEGLVASGCPLGRCAVPEDIARAVAFLASEDAGWVNGQVITVSGGNA